MEEEKQNEKGNGGRGTAISEREEKFIPKHRFDCVNLSLKEHKVLVAQLREVNADLNKQVAGLICRVNETDRVRNENRILRELAAMLLGVTMP